MVSDSQADEMERFKQFLADFCDHHNGSVYTSNDPLPFRLITFRLTETEIEGECASWASEYLHIQKNAPPLLVYLIVRETVRRVRSADLSTFVEENHHNTDETEPCEPCVEYNANGLARFVFSSVNEVCAKWRDNLPVFKLPETTRRHSLHAIRNNRRKMEDRHVVVSDMHTQLGEKLKSDVPCSFYAVYDGHGGVDASYYAAAHLHYLAAQDPQFTESPTRAMLGAFNETDKAFIRKAKREGLRSGTTGVTAVINSDCIHLAWLGDSQALLMRNGQPVTVMEPHSPEREDEKKRIEDMGGCVVYFGAWRVNGSLSVSRSIGDLDYKPYVCSDADSTVIPLDGTEECIILACDGLWDAVTKEEACATIQEHINSGSDLSQVSNILVDMAKENGSGDNITTLVVYLNPYHRQNTEKQELAQSEECNSNNSNSNHTDLEHGHASGAKGTSGRAICRHGQESVGKQSLSELPSYNSTQRAEELSSRITLGAASKGTERISRSDDCKSNSMQTVTVESGDMSRTKVPGRKPTAVS